MVCICGNTDLVVQNSLVLVKFYSMCCKDILLNIASQIHRIVRYLKLK